MTLSQFICPHCHRPFQVDTSFPSLQVACPHCRQPLTPINEPPVNEPPVNEPPVSPPPINEPQVAEPPAAPSARVPSAAIAERTSPSPNGLPSVDLWPPPSAVSTADVPPKQAKAQESITNDFRSRQLVADERAARKFVKNMIVWVCCAIVLVSILAFFLTQGE